MYKPVFPDNVKDLAERLGLYSLGSVEEKADRVLDFTGTEARMFLPEFISLIITGELGGREVSGIVELAAKSRGDSSDREKLVLEFNRELKKVQKAIKTAERFNLDYFSKFFRNQGWANYSGNDILSLRLLPGSCTSYAVLGQDLLKSAGVNSEVMYMTSRRLRGGHSVLRYELENGVWRKCDPKWQKRRDDKGLVFFRGNPALEEEFASGRALVHGRFGTRYEQEVRIK